MEICRRSTPPLRTGQARCARWSTCQQKAVGYAVESAYAWVAYCLRVGIGWMVVKAVSSVCGFSACVQRQVGPLRAPGRGNRGPGRRDRRDRRVLHRRRDRPSQPRLKRSRSGCAGARATVRAAPQVGNDPSCDRMHRCRPTRATRRAQDGSNRRMRAETLVPINGRCESGSLAHRT